MSEISIRYLTVPIVTRCLAVGLDVSLNGHMSNNRASVRNEESTMVSKEVREIRLMRRITLCWYLASLYIAGQEQSS